MSRGVDYLNYVIDQLRNKIQEIDQTISDVQKDIAGSFQSGKCKSGTSETEKSVEEDAGFSVFRKC